ncbi:Aste57867_12128 [Aphanomyces stellatus]|uniref:Aste57867_12128 protein n=1 Tax=Aphanomyces stellatus TaxID=120398 RepID=A0A485KVY7_9STRA|nr:hypothetical protein As57867_012083 [Aphanomyces stellatus]VFT88982.1 Aste57867_12128 [Aphanomyces stellatus]
MLERTGLSPQVLLMTDMLQGIEDKLELLADAQDARLRKLEDALADWNDRVDAIEAKVRGLPERICRAMLHRRDSSVGYIPEDVEIAIHGLAEAVQASLNPTPVAVPNTYDTTSSISDTDMLDNNGSDVEEAPPKRPKLWRRPPAVQPLPSTITDAVVVEASHRQFQWPNGAWRRVPPKWALPKEQCRTMWVYWHRGDTATQIGRYRFLSGDDMQRKADKNGLSTLRSVMMKIDDAALSLVPYLDRLPKLSLRDFLAVFDHSFRVLQKTHTRVDTPRARRLAFPICLMNFTRLVMEEITRMAMINSLIPSEDALNDLSDLDLVAIFDGAYFIFVHRHPSGHFMGRLRLKQTKYESLAHETPQAWRFPKQTTCRLLWEYWFLGDGFSGIRPFGLIDTAGVDFADTTAELRLAKFLVDNLIDLAIDKQLVASEDAVHAMNRCDCMEVFDHVYPILFEDHPWGNLKSGGLTDMPMELYLWTDVCEALRHVRTSTTSTVEILGVPAQLANIERATDLSPSIHSIEGHSKFIPSTRKAIPTPDEANCPFLWSDGSRRQAPEDWSFPNLVCRDAWVGWFHGDLANQIGPYRLLRPLDVHTRDSKMALNNTRAIMDALIQIALARSPVPSEDALGNVMPDKVLRVFDAAYYILARPSVVHVIKDATSP